MQVQVLIGTVKGAFVLKSDADRNRWSIEGPHFKGWKVTACSRDEKTKQFILGTASDVYGPALHTGPALTCEAMTQVKAGPSYPEEGKRKLNQIWRIVTSDDAYWAGVDEAGLFRSEDQGQTWQPVEGLNEHPTRSGWYPGAGGLCAHSILLDPRDASRVWCGISAVGMFRSDDGGQTWTPKNQGVPIIIPDQESSEIGFCVHALVADPDDSDIIYRQDHLGLYRTTDGGDHWEAIENGLRERSFGFPIVLDRETKNLFIFPLESDEFRLPKEGKFRVFRSQNQGDSWEPLSNGLPEESHYGCVLRTAMAADHLSPGGIYLGSTAGTIHVSNDRGESWQSLPHTLPRILTVAVFVDE